jgi:hypothetical protein
MAADGRPVTAMVPRYREASDQPSEKPMGFSLIAETALRLSGAIPRGAGMLDYTGLDRSHLRRSRFTTLSSFRTALRSFTSDTA